MRLGSETKSPADNSADRSLVRLGSRKGAEEAVPSQRPVKQPERGEEGKDHLARRLPALQNPGQSMDGSSHANEESAFNSRFSSSELGKDLVLTRQRFGIRRISQPVLRKPQHLPNISSMNFRRGTSSRFLAQPSEAEEKHSNDARADHADHERVSRTQQVRPVPFDQRHQRKESHE